MATQYAYDGLGRTSLVTQHGILAGAFDPASEQFASTRTRVTRIEYDTQSRPVTTTLNYQAGVLPSAAVNVQTVTYYDAAGNVTWQRDALGRWTKLAYDELNRPIKTIVNYENGDPLTVDSANQDWAALTDTDIIHVTEYDDTGRVAATIEQYVDGVFDTTFQNRIHDRRTVYGYDALGRVEQVTWLPIDPADPHYDPSRTDSNLTSRTAYDDTAGGVPSAARMRWGTGRASSTMPWGA